MTDSSAVPATTDRDEAEKAITRDSTEQAIRTILREHTHKLGICCRCGYGEGEQFPVSEHRHRAHVASVIAGYMADVWEQGIQNGDCECGHDSGCRFQTAVNPYRVEGNQP